jgi:alginate O-acetyltransferase complex protein AlgI
MAFDAGSIGCTDSWVGAVAYAFQIYFDFSAYSDMAIGLGLMLGFMFAKNFDSPYLSQSITEFWRRWHLSLSTWLRDNLYYPLGGRGTRVSWRRLVRLFQRLPICQP